MFRTCTFFFLLWAKIIVTINLTSFRKRTHLKTWLNIVRPRLKSMQKNRGKMTCKGICTRHKASSRYGTGHKRCKSCDVFIKWDGLCCPCCGYKLRTRPTNIKLKAKLRKVRETQETQKIRIFYY